MPSLPLGEISLETFLKEYWQKKPLLIRNALPNLELPVSADELAGLACEEFVESRLVIQDGVSERWELAHGPFTEETFRELPEAHWTLLVQAVDHWVPAAAQFLARFHFIPSWRIDDLMISYASDGGGVGPHYDNYDVFLVQASGRRRWEIGGRFDANSPRRPDTPVLILTDWEPECSWIVGPGDMLYVPPCIGHHGVAVGNDCMTCSVGFRAPSHGEILRGFADYVADALSEEKRYSDPGLVPQACPGSLTPEALEAVHRIVTDYAKDKTLLAEWFGRFITAPKYPEEEPTTPIYRIEGLQAHISTGGRLVRNEGSRFAFQEQGGELRLFVDGHCYPCPKSQSELVQALCAELMINPRKYLHSVPHLQLLVDLLNQGSLYLSD
ncbi:MAG: cupin domain-containing protein [Nitrospirales bacterium]|nr:cupin domain-containing protein [Nitrospira sp.]MDR4501990.1 cupin domain-containing protein [Nitrospirales bacterium]